MSSKFSLWILLFSALATAASAADDSGAIDRLLDRIVQQEDQFVQDMRSRTAIIETYIQETPNDADAAPVVRDHYFLAKLAFTKGLDYTPMVISAETRKSSRIPFLRRSAAVFVPSGFAQMVLIDGDGFSRKNYSMEYIHREFLGQIRCLVFDVSPLDKKAPGKFRGRVWVEDHDYRVVRFNGTYTNSSTAHVYVHFDSWRVNVTGDQWVPAYVYVEESQPAEKGPTIPKFKGQTRLWGYNIAKTGKLDELTSIAVEAEKSVTDSAAPPETSPLERQRLWERQAEKNILERLEKSGLLAPPGPVDDVLNTVVGNLIVSNNLGVEAKCRVLLTTPLETFSVGQTIVVSRGLIDVLPDEASLAMVLSSELAHIALGHRTDTHFAFFDQTMLTEGELLGRLRLARPEAQVQAAGEKAIEILTKSPYGPKLANAGLFLKALAERAPQLPSLIRANLGDQLASGSTLTSMQELADKAPALDQDKLEQIAALPLGSRIRLDPWNDEISLLQGKSVALLSARDKLPFEVTPFLIFLTRAGSPARDQNPAAGSGVPVQPNAGNSTKEQ
jgi:hypothetical protein